MHQAVPCTVPDVPLPPGCVGALRRVPDLFLKAVARDKSPTESVQFNLGPVDPAMDTALFFFRWTAETNTVIANINIVLSDMRSLPALHGVLNGSPAARFYLLCRTYFSEFYRFREIFGVFIKAAADRGYLNRDEAKGLRQLVHDTFAETIHMRNILVHDSPAWTGPDHAELSVFDMAWTRDLSLIHKESGEVRDISVPLSRACLNTANMLEAEGRRAAHVLGHIIGLIAPAVP